jgi:hypothetical protein
MWGANRTLVIIGAIAVFWAIWSSSQELSVKVIWTAAVIVVLLVDAFWQPIVRRLPEAVRGILDKTWRFLTHPLPSMAILIGLLSAAYWTSNRTYLIPLLVGLVLLVPQTLGWRQLLRVPAKANEQTTKDLLADLEILEGAPRAGPDGPSVVELPFQGTARNTFVLVRGPTLHDVRVEFDVILKPSAVLNVVLRYDSQTQSGYMLRVDSRDGFFNAILVMTRGVWGAERHLSQFRTAADTWVHVVASGHGLHLHLERDGETVSTADDGTFSEGRVGFFSEVADAAIRGVVVSPG